jgi:hypothetical protein
MQKAEELPTISDTDPAPACLPILIKAVAAD